MSERIDYVELPGGDLAATKSFYASAFGWGFTDYGRRTQGSRTPVWMVAYQLATLPLRQRRSCS